MPEIEVTLPEEVYAEFERIAEEEFVNREEAIEELLAAGVDAYTRDYAVEETDFAEEYADDMWHTAGEPDGSSGETDFDI
ncbi:MAG TPA: ribbon-helix-helix protein, CopG family [Halobacteriales archaeon]|nr:ribbon-helix-helix protein, CopG family [Halobacteriales archaeon]